MPSLTGRKRNKGQVVNIVNHSVSPPPGHSGYRPGSTQNIETGPHPSSFGSDAARWRYTAVTRAAHKVTVVLP